MFRATRVLTGRLDGSAEADESKNFQAMSAQEWMTEADAVGTKVCEKAYHTHEMQLLLITKFLPAMVVGSRREAQRSKRSETLSSRARKRVS